MVYTRIAVLELDIKEVIKVTLRCWIIDIERKIGWIFHEKEAQAGEVVILRVKRGIHENGSHVHIMLQLWY